MTLKKTKLYIILAIVYSCVFNILSVTEVGATEESADVIRTAYMPANYDNFAIATSNIINQESIKTGYLLLGPSTYYVNNPLIIDQKTPNVFIHGSDRFRSILKPKDSSKPLFIIQGAQYVNMTNLRLGGFEKLQGVNLVTEGNTYTILDLVDTFIEKGAVVYNAPGDYRIQSSYFTGQGKVASQIVLNNPEANLFVFGGNITRSGIDNGANLSEYSHVRVSAGRFRIFGTGTQNARGFADYRIDSAAPAGLAHQIVNVRSEGNNGKLPIGSSFIYVPPTIEKVDIDIINSAGSWKLSGTHKSTLAMYNAMGTLRLLGNTSTSGAGSYITQSNPNDFKLVAIGNTLSKVADLPSYITEKSLPENLYANSIKMPPFLKSTQDSTINNWQKIELEVDIPDLIPRPKLNKPLPGMVNVKDYGALGNGVKDDTAAIQKALNKHSSVYFPAGHYKITDSLKYNTTKSNSHAAGGYIAGYDKNQVDIIRQSDGAIFETQGMAYATIQGLTLKSKKLAKIKSGQKAALNLEFTNGIGHATQSNSVYDISIENANIGIAIGNQSTQQCSENLFNNVEIHNSNLAVSVGGYNALANIFYNLIVNNADNVIGHGGSLNGGTWTIVSAKFTNISGNVLFFKNSSDSVFFLDKLIANNVSLFDIGNTGASFNIFLNRSSFSDVNFSINSSGGIFLNDSQLSNVSAKGSAAMSSNYVVNNTLYPLSANSVIKNNTIKMGH